jgi:hypothetical protein
MDKELAAKRLAGHDRVIAARSLLRLNLERWTAAQSSRHFPTVDDVDVIKASRTAATEYGNAVAEYVQLLGMTSH